MNDVDLDRFEFIKRCYAAKSSFRELDFINLTYFEKPFMQNLLNLGPQSSACTTQ